MAVNGGKDMPTAEKGCNMRFFGLKTCDTCRKALRALKDAGFAPQVIDVRSDGVAPADQAAMIAEFGDAVINRASTTWRGLSQDEQASDAATLLAAHPTLMKRPVIDGPDGWTVGWAKPVQSRYLGEAGKDA